LKSVNYNGSKIIAINYPILLFVQLTINLR